MSKAKLSAPEVKRLLETGMRVQVFNQVGNNWHGTIRAVNSKSATVEAAGSCIHTNHRDAQGKFDDGNHYVVPFLDLLEPEVAFGARLLVTALLNTEVAGSNPAQ